MQKDDCRQHNWFLGLLPKQLYAFDTLAISFIGRVYHSQCNSEERETEGEGEKER